VKQRLARLTQGEWLVLIAGVALIVDLIWLPWHSIPVSNRDLQVLESRGIFVDTTYTAVQGSNIGYGVAAVLLTAVMIVQIAVARLLAVRLPQPPVPWSQIHLILGIFVAVLIVIKLVRATEFLGYGAYSAILAAVLVAYGGYRIASEPGEPA
jgi:uncharacterized membrane protein